MENATCRSRKNFNFGKNITNTEHQYLLIDTQEALDELITKIKQQKTIICFDTETTSVDANNCELVGISFSIKPS
jgi:DNA polymerase-1